MHPGLDPHSGELATSYWPKPEPLVAVLNVFLRRLPFMWPSKVAFLGIVLTLLDVPTGGRTNIVVFVESTEPRRVPTHVRRVAAFDVGE